MAPVWRISFIPSTLARIFGPHKCTSTRIHTNTSEYVSGHKLYTRLIHHKKSKTKEQSCCTHTEDEEELNEHGTKGQDACHQDSTRKTRTHVQTMM